jgi:hypothetical protein
MPSYSGKFQYLNADGSAADDIWPLINLSPQGRENFVFPSTSFSQHTAQRD